MKVTTGWSKTPGLQNGEMKVNFYFHNHSFRRFPSNGIFQADKIIRSRQYQIALQVTSRCHETRTTNAELLHAHPIQ